MKREIRVHVQHFFRPDPEAVRRAIEAIIRFSDEAMAREEHASEAKKAETNQAS